MNKLLILSILIVSFGYADENYAEHERKMQQIQKETGKGSMNQNQYRNEKQNAYKKQIKNQYKDGSGISSTRDTSGGMSGNRGGGKGRR